ncbi:MAG: hypothetical protein HY075_07940 [Deltaproteobacteria bacterium]|nr:hypothetical protein [Deltaproteobacteria bacterium]
MKTRIFLVVALTLQLPVFGAEKKVTPPAPQDAKQVVLNDSWYTMQAGSTPFGYFHEVIEQRGENFSYRYAMRKIENTSLYEENIGAVARLDLTPIAFNLNKVGTGATETTDATYAPGPNGSGNFSIKISGAKVASFKRGCPKNTILDVFFPLHLSKIWDKLKPGYKGWLSTFAEDPEHADFRARTVHYEVKGKDAANSCLNVHVEMDNVRGDWCMTPEGKLVDLKVGSYHVRKVKDEAEARAFVAGVMPKAKEGK